MKRVVYSEIPGDAAWWQASRIFSGRFMWVFTILLCATVLIANFAPLNDGHKMAVVSLMVTITLTPLLLAALFIFATYKLWDLQEPYVRAMIKELQQHRVFTQWEELCLEAKRLARQERDRTALQKGDLYEADEEAIKVEHDGYEQDLLSELDDERDIVINNIDKYKIVLENPSLIKANEIIKEA